MFRSRTSVVSTTGLGLHGQLSTDAHPDLLTTATAAAIAITAQGGQDCGATTLLSSEDARKKAFGAQAAFGRKMKNIGPLPVIRGVTSSI